MTKQEKFLNEIKSGCMTLWKSFGILPSVAAGQAALESGWGQSVLSQKYNNLFGIKGEYEGSSVHLPTTEYLDGDKPVAVIDKFRSYPDLNASMVDYGKYLSEKELYQEALGVRDYRTQIERIHKAGYATDPKYSEKVIQIIEKYELYKWDQIAFNSENEGVESKMATIYLDAGHGGKDTGAVGNGLVEKNLNLSMALRVGEILTNDYEGVKVLYSRTTDKTMSLSERSNAANKANVDFYMSFHVNGGGGSGYEDFIYIKLSTGGATDLARQKIHNEVKKVLEKYGSINRGMKKADFHVLRETKMPAVLVETLFIDNAKDAELLKNKTFLEDMAQAYAKGLANVVGAKKKPKPQPADDGMIYRVQVGAFKVKANAEKLREQLVKQGYKDAFIQASKIN